MSYWVVDGWVRCVRELLGGGWLGEVCAVLVCLFMWFCLQDAMQKALMHDRVSFHGRQVYVSRCSGDRKQQGTEAPVSRVRPCHLAWMVLTVWASVCMCMCVAHLC